ncbi:hypothetical protein Q3G72_006281 [Acer saccharum]|nr:hypothetical protein Q3G72_006281 [Acer saccharum]
MKGSSTVSSATTARPQPPRFCLRRSLKVKFINGLEHMITGAEFGSFKSATHDVPDWVSKENCPDFSILYEPKNKATYSSWSKKTLMTKKTFLKQSINVVPCLRRAAWIVEEYYEGAGGESLVDNDGWLATHGKPKVLKQILFMRRIINLLVMIKSVIRTPRLMNLGKKRMGFEIHESKAPSVLGSKIRVEQGREGVYRGSKQQVNHLDNGSFAAVLKRNMKVCKAKLVVEKRGEISSTEGSAGNVSSKFSEFEDGGGQMVECGKQIGGCIKKRESRLVFSCSENGPNIDGSNGGLQSSKGPVGSIHTNEDQLGHQSKGFEGCQDSSLGFNDEESPTPNPLLLKTGLQPSHVEEVLNSTSGGGHRNGKKSGGRNVLRYELQDLNLISVEVVNCAEVIVETLSNLPKRRKDRKYCHSIKTVDLIKF